jgi:hypothetical protein
MARGFESKSVQSQWADAEARADDKGQGKREEPEERLKRQKRHSLSLSRRRVEYDLAKATNPANRATLERALEHLDRELARLEAADPKQ